MKAKLICLTACFAILFAPLFLGISLDGKAHAMGIFGGGGGNKDNTPSPGVVSEVPDSGPAPVSHAPEPATLILFGAGAVGLAAVRKKFRKK